MEGASCSLAPPKPGHGERKAPLLAQPTIFLMSSNEQFFRSCAFCFARLPRSTDLKVLRTANVPTASCCCVICPQLNLTPACPGAGNRHAAEHSASSACPPTLTFCHRRLPEESAADLQEKPSEKVGEAGGSTAARQRTRQKPTRTPPPLVLGWIGPCAGHEPR